jgi:NDP-sugar pyrophosphorylase family protein
MKAFILAAGKGTRLAPLTGNKPKALVEVNGKPMLQGVIERLKDRGFTEFMINIHHFGQQITDFLKANNNFNVDIKISDERDLLLDTGGAVVKAARFFKGSQPVLVHNADIYSNADFAKLMDNHKKSGALVSLLVRNRNSTRKLLFNNRMALTGWKNLKTGEYKWVGDKTPHYTERAFSGIYIASAGYPEKIGLQGSFPVVPQWLKLARTEPVVGVENNNDLWFDLGTIEKIKEAELSIQSHGQ